MKGYKVFTVQTLYLENWVDNYVTYPFYMLVKKKQKMRFSACLSYIFIISTLATVFAFCFTQKYTSKIVSKGLEHRYIH